MGTPRRNFNNFSPYNSPRMGSYPSQSEHYMSHHAGGMQTPQQQQNFGFYEDRGPGPGSSQPKTAHFYQNRTPQEQQRQTPQFRNYGQRSGGPRGNQRRDSNGPPAFSQYFHQSMLEDPWRDLMARHNAIYQPQQETT